MIVKNFYNFFIFDLLSQFPYRSSLMNNAMHTWCSFISNCNTHSVYTSTYICPQLYFSITNQIQLLTYSINHNAVLSGFLSKFC
jgi:hypothetical protein